MHDSDVGLSGVPLPDGGDPRPVSRGSKLQVAFLGIDSLYLVVEYPHTDVFARWSAVVSDFNDPQLYSGIPLEDMVIRKGGNGYKLAVWDGDTRLFITDRVNDNLKDTPSANQGMGVMLQLSPKWLRQHGDILSPQKFRENIYAQLALFGLKAPETYAIRLNRLDVTIDVLGLAVSSLSADEWTEKWVGRGHKKSYHVSTFDSLEGITVGTSQGAVRFKVYDKVAKARLDDTWRFWCSVWGIPDDSYNFDVARFEWSIQCHKAAFVNMRYLSEFTFQGFLDLLNYVTQKWGQLRVPQADDLNQSRWPLDPLWQNLLNLIDDWSFNYKGMAKREYDYSYEVHDRLVRSFAGWLAGMKVRVGLELEKDSPANLEEVFLYLDEHGYTLSDIARKAAKKWEIASRLSGKVKRDGE